MNQSDRSVFSVSVTRGIIWSIDNQEEMESSSLSVKVTKHLRHSSSGLASDTEEEDDDEENSILSGDRDRESLVELTVPFHCGAKHGTGEFVFMARRKLGALAITCAPRLEDWAEVVRSESLGGSANCVLSS